MSAQFSLLNWAFTAGLTRLASPVAPATVDTPEPPADGEADALGAGVALAGALADAEADGVADALACAAVRLRDRLAISFAPAPLDAPFPSCPRAPLLADELADADAVGDALADGVGDADPLADGVGVGVVTGVVAPVFGACRITWRNSSWAVVPTRFTTFWLPAPGTATLMMSLPCCWTCASVKPAPFTRLAMMFLAWVMSAANCALDTPLGALAFSATVVPLVRSRPRWTLKSLPHCPGEPMFPPTMASSSTTISAASPASARPGRETLPLGGANSRLSFGSRVPRPDAGRGAAGQSAVRSS